MITKQQLENAALAMGFPEPYTYLDGSGLLWYERLGLVWWKPLDPTTQGKADLQDLTLAFPLDVSWYHDSVTVRYKRDIIEDVYFINGDKHAALAEAVVSAASQIWESKNGN
jgi:hypothetical protein